MMTPLRRSGLLLALALALAAAGCAARQADPAQKAQVRRIPVEDFFRNPQSARFSVSPDGRLLAFLKPVNGRLNIFVRPVAGGDETQLTHATDRDIVHFLFKGNGRILYLQDTGGDEDFHVYRVPVTGGPAVDLTPFPKVRAELVDDLEDDDAQILVGLNRRDPRIHDVYRLTVDTGRLTLVAKNPGTVEGWLTDNKGRVRVAETSDGLHSTLLYRSTEKSPWKELVTTDFRDTFTALGFDFDEKTLFVASNLHRDKIGVFRYDPESRTLGEMVSEHPDVDVTHIRLSRRKKKLVTASFTTDRPHPVFFDQEEKDIYESLHSRFPDANIGYGSMSKDERVRVAVVSSDVSPGTSYLLDTASGRLTELARSRPWLAPDELAKTSYVFYQARDGLSIPAYLTLPRNTDGHKLPLVIIPHGGPWVRETWGYDPEAQFLANRGYAVLQPNYRGSTGYGRAFWEASFKQWGRAMQDDLTDGVNWLVESGLVDPKRVCISGASYGGYAALAGAAFTPTLYACAVDEVGPSNLFTLMASFPPYWELGRKKMYAMIGDPTADKQLLTDASPLFSADNIRIPLLVAQGANDPRVKQAESDQIVEALKKRGIPVTYLLKTDEGHGFQGETNRIELYKVMDEFLATHLAGKKQ